MSIMTRKLFLIALLVGAVAAGYSSPVWAGPLIDGISAVATYVIDTHVLMLMDADSVRFGCF